jgi:hypothetical protein
MNTNIPTFSDVSSIYHNNNLNSVLDVRRSEISSGRPPWEA